MKFLIPAFFCLIVSCAPPRIDLLIKNGKIIDGTGNPWFYGDIAVKDGKIITIGKIIDTSAVKVIDATGLVVSPGFIDVHTHIEGGESTTPTADNFIYDGVTTVITGNCGSSKVDISSYVRFINSLKLSVNTASLIGHNDIRKAVMGSVNRSPSEDELQKMETIVARAMQDGAVGISTGLIYIPGTYAKTEEIIRLAKIAAVRGGVYATHMRNEADSVQQAIGEALRIGREAGIPVEISHFKVSGQQNWKRSIETLALIEQARQEGIDVTIDQYPYTASSTSLSTLLPEDVLSDGADSVKARLQRPEIKQYVIDSMLRNLNKRKLDHFSYAMVAYHAADTTLNGKSIEAINLLKGKKHEARYEAETVIEMMQHGGAGMVFHGMSEWDVRNILSYSFNMFASDASIRAFGSGVPHPRGYGTNARVLGRYVRDEKIILLEEAIRRMTSLPAQKFKLKNRGLLLPRYAADIVLFDAGAVADLSTFEQPHAYSRGFRYVIVNGRLVVDQGKHTGERSGRFLYGAFYNGIGK
ncbi:MAG: D-aminoacylase [Chitinophagaceae bacterium]